MMYDVIIVGAGQAGLTAGYYLKKTNLSFLIIDGEKQIGDNWRDRYDSLKLFSPRTITSLPGLEVTGNQDGYASKNEMADYLRDYASTFELPVILNTEITRIEKENHYLTVTSKTRKKFTTKNIIIATGQFHIPRIPKHLGKMSDKVVHLHTKEYKNTKQLVPGTTLVVGAGNSGVQIALEITKLKNQEVYLSYGKKPKFVPARLFGKSIYWYGNKLGLLQFITAIPKDSFLGNKMYKAHQRGNQIIGLDLLYALRNGQLTLKPRLLNIDGSTAYFADKSRVSVDNIVWATGYTTDFSWITIPDVFDHDTNPIHKRGVTPVSGLYFLGLEWLYGRGSGAFIGIKRDARHIVDAITARN